MSCRSKVFLSLLLSGLLFTCLLTGAQAASNYTIAWNSENTFLVSPSTLGSWYVVENNSSGIWNIMWERTLTLANTPVTVQALPGIVCDYRVRIYDSEGGDLEATSNVITYNPKTFLLTYQKEYNLASITWDSVENVTKYTIQFATSTQFNWVDYRLANLDPSVNTYILSDSGFIDKYVRVVAWNGSRVLSYSNSVYVGEITEEITFVPPSTDDPTVTRPPLPLDTVSVPEWNHSQVESFWSICFSFLHYTNIGSFFLLCFSITVSFAIVTYIVFKLH